jgi:hypothetical protein
MTGVNQAAVAGKGVLVWAGWGHLYARPAMMFILNKY